LQSDSSVNSVQNPSFEQIVYPSAYYNNSVLQLQLISLQSLEALIQERRLGIAQVTPLGRFSQLRCRIVKLVMSHLITASMHGIEATKQRNYGIARVCTHSGWEVH